MPLIYCLVFLEICHVYFEMSWKVLSFHYLLAVVINLVGFKWDTALHYMGTILNFRIAGLAS